MITEPILDSHPDPELKVNRDFKANPLTEQEKMTLQLAHLYIAYTELFAAAKKVFDGARYFNKAKHQMAVLTNDVRGLALQMDKGIPQMLNYEDDEPSAESPPEVVEEKVQ